MTLGPPPPGGARCNQGEGASVTRDGKIKSSTASDVRALREENASDDACKFIGKERLHFTATDEPEKPTEESTDERYSRLWEEDVHIGTKDRNTCAKVVDVLSDLRTSEPSGLVIFPRQSTESR